VTMRGTWSARAAAVRTGALMAFLACHYSAKPPPEAKIRCQGPADCPAAVPMCVPVPGLDRGVCCRDSNCLASATDDGGATIVAPDAGRPGSGDGWGSADATVGRCSGALPDGGCSSLELVDDGFDLDEGFAGLADWSCGGPYCVSGGLAP
jgi:hypothetical protein